MAFNAQGGMFQQHLQALVNPGGQFTVQQARKYIYRQGAQGAQWLSGRVFESRLRAAGWSLTGVTALSP